MDMVIFWPVQDVLPGKNSTGENYQEVVDLHLKVPEKIFYICLEVALEMNTGIIKELQMEKSKQ